MGCSINIDFSIFKDKIIVLAFIFIIMLSIFLICMIKSDTSVSLPIKHNHTKNIQKWTLIPISGDTDCRVYDSVFGGTGQNGSSHGSCHMCNCTLVDERDI